MFYTVQAGPSEATITRSRGKAYTEAQAVAVAERLVALGYSACATFEGAPLARRAEKEGLLTDPPGGE